MFDPKSFCQRQKCRYLKFIPSQMLQVSNIYLQNWVMYRVNVAKYTSTMEHLGLLGSQFFKEHLLLETMPQMINILPVMVLHPDQ